MQIFPSRQSDEEYVATLRRSLVFWDRWHWIGALFFIAMILLLGGLFERAVRMLAGMQPGGNPNGVWFGFLCGTVIGITFGWMVSSLLHQLTNWINGFRTERLLVAHYQSSEQPSVDPEAESVHVDAVE